jgi:hypothetical protein
VVVVCVVVVVVVVVVRVERVEIPTAGTCVMFLFKITRASLHILYIYRVE